MGKVPAGGPSTVNGVIYQLFYALLTLGRLRVQDPALDGTELGSATLVLEPLNGGDQQLLQPIGRVVTQLKSRGSGGTWSLLEVVHEVLPDLYRAVDDREAEYRFVTEGRRGDWAAVEAAFQTLPDDGPADDPLATIDDIRIIPFRSQIGTNALLKSPPTLRGIVGWIVAVLRQRREVEAEPYSTTCRKTIQLLRGFRFDEGIARDVLMQEIDRMMLAVVGPAEDLPARRDHALLELARRACQGDAQLTANEFFEIIGCSGVPLTHWTKLIERSLYNLNRTLRRKQTNVGIDVRQGFTESLFENWSTVSPILVLTGESGCGKSWHGYALLKHAARNGALVILVDAWGDSERDLHSAAHVLWRDVLDHDQVLDLSRLRKRLRDLGQPDRDRRVILMVDNVTSEDEARRLIESDWEGWGIRLLITCQPAVSDAIRSRLHTRGRVEKVSDFTLMELRSYLDQMVDIPWESIPPDVRKTLRLPLLARLFGEVVPTAGWSPHNEYELYERVWCQLRERGVEPFAIDGLLNLALRLVTESTSYPWTSAELTAEGLDASKTNQLLRGGWLRETADGRYEVRHDRLLNWTIGEAIFRQLQRDPERSAPIAELTGKLLNKPRMACGRLLAYVPMDVLWLLSGSHERLRALVPLFVEQYERNLRRSRVEILDRQLLPTLGTRAVPLLMERLRSAVAVGTSHRIDAVVNGLNTSLGEDGVNSIRDLLSDQSPKIQLAAVRWAALRPHPSILDALWRIHVAGVRDPAIFLDNPKRNWLLYEDTFAAMKAAVRIDPAWLEQAIRDADPGTAPVHDLAYLVSATRDPAVWDRCKALLKTKVDSAHERSLANCMLTFRDVTELDWLADRVEVQADLLGSAALRTLSAIDPTKALELLDRLGEGDQYMARSWYLPDLDLRKPQEIKAYFAKRIRHHSRPLHCALVLQGREDMLDPDTFDFLLNVLRDRLDIATSLHSNEVAGDCRRGIDLMLAVHRPELLSCIRKRRGTELESRLVYRAIDMGPQVGMWKVTDKFEILDALARIGGEGFNRVVDDWLERGGWNGQLHAVTCALRRLSPRTLELLTIISTTGGEDVDEQHQRILRGDATATLASHSQWEPVFRYYLNVGLMSSTLVDELSPLPDQPINDTTLAVALQSFEDVSGPSVGAVLSIGLANREDLLPKIRLTLSQSPPGSDLANACLLALQWLVDTDPATVPFVQRHLTANYNDAINTLLANGSPTAWAVLAESSRQHTDIELATILANNAQTRENGVDAIRRLALDRTQFSRELGFTTILQRLQPELLPTIADCPEILTFAEEVATDSHPGVFSHNETAAALRIFGVKHSAEAYATGLARLRGPEGEHYAVVLSEIDPSRAANDFLETVRAGTTTRVLRAVAGAFAGLGPDAMTPLQEWLQASSRDRRVAACRLAGFLSPTAELANGVRARADDDSRDVVDAALMAYGRHQQVRIGEDLVRAFQNETDATHQWNLLDALIAIADPDGTTPTQWIDTIRPSLTPAMRHHLFEDVKRRRKELIDQDNKEDERNR